MKSVVLGMRRSALFIALALACQGAWAGPVEDFDAGSKAYLSGDIVGAMPILRRAADAGHAPAQVMLGGILDYSEFDEEAVVYYRKAALQGYADGQFAFGTMLSLGEGIKKDLAEARRWIFLAAEQGHKPAINTVAKAYIDGQLEIAENERQSVEAFKWVKLAAEQDFLPAVDALVLVYRNGGMGQVADAAAASQWQAKANELRNIKPGKGKGKKKEIVK